MVQQDNWDTLERVKVREGVTRRVFSGKNSMLALNEIMPEAGPAQHSHSHEQLLVIMKGQAEFVLGDKILYLKEGDVLFVPPDIPHSLKVIGDEPVLNLDVFSPIREDYLLEK